MLPLKVAQAPAAAAKTSTDRIIPQPLLT
ncbi:hypothetical protein EAE97_007564 [Botrytis byssoidea]|uniref:Uncharacterized protein n=1 Tax=Botrytis byssoidea TaxID=139641 RepID=A0A9P5IGZ2_9HELO|nr:hypothetical protein EAE97_007564 [Botrytis byssoidea]